MRIHFGIASACGRGRQIIAHPSHFVCQGKVIFMKLSLHYLIPSVLQEKERSKDLLEAAKHCESMATELLALASSLEGAARLLTAQDRRQMPLLDILVEQEQKEVISHPAVQRYLQVSSKEG